MTNAEKWANEIIEIARTGNRVAVQNGKPVKCGDMFCKGCDLYHVEGSQNTCHLKRLEWFNEEYVEAPVDWNKVKVDTKVLVSNDGEHWYRRYYADYVGGQIKTFWGGNTSWSDFPPSPKAWGCRKSVN